MMLRLGLDLPHRDGALAEKANRFRLTIAVEMANGSREIAASSLPPISTLESTTADYRTLTEGPLGVCYGRNTARKTI